MVGISKREFIRWLPNEASEPTSTLVVTSPGRWFVDIRAMRPDSAKGGPWPVGEERITVDQLDWAIGGSSTSWLVGDGPISRGQWRHWVDSRTAKAEDLVDEGYNFPQEDGTTLEKGSMVNPATGNLTEYEESWSDEKPRTVETPGVHSVVLRLEEGDSKGMVVLLGQYCQGFMRKGDDLTAERWEWSEGGWKRTIILGDGILPCSEILQGKPSSLELGSVVKAGSDIWKVIESVE